MTGKVTRKNVRVREAPKERAAWSYSEPRVRIAPSSEETKKGMATNVWAMMTARVVKPISIPITDRCSPSSPRRPQVSSRARPATTGGSIMGRVTTVRSRRAHQRSGRFASTKASGTPNRTQIARVVPHVRNDNHRASWETAVETSWPKRAHGVCTKIVTRGNARKRAAIPPGTVNQGAYFSFINTPVARRSGPLKDFYLLVGAVKPYFFKIFCPASERM